MRALVLAGTAFAIAAWPCLARGDAYADYAAARHRAFVGFSAGDGKIASVSYTDTTSGQKDGAPLEIVQIHRVGVIYRSDITDLKAKVGYSEGFTGNVFWYSDFNGLTVPVYGDSAKMRIAQDLLFTDTIATLPWQSVGSKYVSGKNVDVFHVAPPHSYSVDLYVDKETGAYDRVVIDPGGDRETTIVILGYSEAARGTKIVSKWSIEHRNHSLSAIAANAIVPNDKLQPPSQIAHWSFLNATPFPIKLTRHRILVEATVNGVQGLFVLDSGAQNIVLSGTFARRAGLHAVGHSELFGMGGVERVDTGVADTIDIGGNVLKNATVYFGSKTFDDEAPDGLMGFDLFGGALVALDFEKSTMQLSDPSLTSLESIQGLHVRVDLGDGLPQTPLRVQHHVVLYSLLDTGAPLMAIPEDLLTREGLHYEDGQYTGCGMLDDISLGPVSLGKPGVCAYLEPGGHDAIVGYEFFRAFARVYFDYPAATMVFVVPEHPHEPFR